MCPIATMDMLRLTLIYSWIRLEPEISRIKRHKSNDWNYNSLSMEMRKSSCALWIMTLRMANSHMRLAEPHEWMVSNLLSPYSITLAMQAQSDSCGCGKLIVSGFINAEDNKATEQKTEQTAPAYSPGLVHHPKIRARRYTLPSVFEPPTDSISGPAGPIAVNAPAAMIRGFGTSNKGTSTVDHSSGRMSQSAAGVAGKPRTQRPGKWQPRTRAKTTSPGQHLHINPYVRNYLATLTPREYAQSFPRSSSRSRGLITGR
jgi:hypothetical protein